MAIIFYFCLPLMKKITVVVPLYNEAKSIPELAKRLTKVLKAYNYEIIFVNDGSTDGSEAVLNQIAEQNERIKVIHFKRNYGQTAAINAGVQHANGDVIVLIDADLENQPEDIPKLLKKLQEGYDVVSGWRRERWKKQWLTRKLPSKIANWLISKLSGVHLHDYGCTLKAYKADVIKDVRLYGEMHRFIPIYCKWEGGKITEVPVSYQPRKYGSSKYGLTRTFKVLLDLVLIVFMQKYMSRPIHFFGGAGLWAFVFGFIVFGIALYFKLTGQKDFVETPLPVLSVTFIIIGVQMILMGVIAEMLMRTYYESQERFPYKIKAKKNL